MPRRKEIFVVGEIYHIVNRSLSGTPIFQGKYLVNRFLKTTQYYLTSSPQVSYSNSDIYSDNPSSLNSSSNLVTIFAYCIMPNHFHFILRQDKNNGIRIFIQRLINSYSHYYNIKNNRKGPLFEGAFKAIRVETEEQLLHLSRYIHLNPVTSYLTENPKDYQFSSYSSYVGGNQPLKIDTTMIMSNFSSPKKYMEFVLSRKDYQRKLEEIKHLLKENPGS